MTKRASWNCILRSRCQNSSNMQEIKEINKKSHHCLNISNLFQWTLGSCPTTLSMKYLNSPLVMFQRIVLICMKVGERRYQICKTYTKKKWIYNNMVLRFRNRTGLLKRRRGPCSIKLWIHFTTLGNCSRNRRNQKYTTNKNPPIKNL